MKKVTLKIYSRKEKLPDKSGEYLTFSSFENWANWNVLGYSSRYKLFNLHGVRRSGKV